MQMGVLSPSIFRMIEQSDQELASREGGTRPKTRTLVLWDDQERSRSLDLWLRKAVFQSHLTGGKNEYVMVLGNPVRKQ